MAAPRRARAACRTPDGEALYLRLSTTPDRPGAVRRERPTGSARSGCGPTSSPAASGCASPAAGDDRVVLAACGAIVPEALAAAALLADGGRRRGDRALPLLPRPPLPRLAGTAARRRCADAPVGAVAPRAARRTPTSAASRSSRSSTARATRSSFVGSALGVRSVPLGVDRFGQTGSQPEVYAEYGIDAASIATAALVALEP